MNSTWLIGTLLGIAFAALILNLAGKNDDDPLNHPDQVIYSYFRGKGGKQKRHGGRKK